MKIKIRPDDATTLQADDWLQMSDWLAELRDMARAEPPGDNRAEPPGDNRGEPPGDNRAEPPGDACAGPAGGGRVRAPGSGRAEGAARRARPEFAVRPAGPARLAGPPGATVRAVIGDQLRLPITWCEMGCCISWHSDPAALGEGDARARAIGAGWRTDAFGRLACPRCQQTDPDFRASRPVVPWDRYTAIVAAGRITACGGRASMPAPGW
jgi:hypothetical protein